MKYASRQAACQSKRRYDSEVSAFNQAARMCGSKKHRIPKLRAYRCPHCEGWHLTSQVA